MQVPWIAFEAGLGIVIVGWCVWELMSLRRERERDRAKAQAKGDDVSPKTSPTSDA